MKLFFHLLFSSYLILLVNSTLEPNEVNGFLKDFAKTKPMGYSIKHFTEKLLEEVMKLSLRDSLLSSGEMNAVPTLKMVTLLDYNNLSRFFLQMNVSHNLTMEDFNEMIHSSFGNKSDTNSVLENEESMDLFLSKLLKFISKSNVQEGMKKDASKNKMYFYLYLITKLKQNYLNQTTDISLASILNSEKDLNITEFIDYTLKFNSSDLPFSEYFNEENLKKPEYQNKTLIEFSKLLHKYLKNGGKTAEMLEQEKKTPGTDILLIILISVIAMIVFLGAVFFTKRYLKNRYVNLNGYKNPEKDNNILSAK